MRILHTSDWHLGRSFHEVGLLGAQAAFVDWLVQVVRSERITAVLVSGDVYDRALPSPDTVALLDDALTRLVDAGATVVLSSGNHDSAVRLGFASGLLDSAGVHLRTSVESIGRPVVLGDVAVYPLPYLEPSLTAPVLQTRPTHQDVLEAAMTRVRADAAHRPTSIVMAHTFTAHATPCDSERDITVGGVQLVPVDTFRGVSYAALGHLHGAQRVGDQAAYSGSPVAMGFGEVGHVKAVQVLEVQPGQVRATSLPTPVQRPLAVLRGDIEQVLASPDHRDAEGAYCKAVLTDAVRPLGAFDRLRRRFPHLLQLTFEPRGEVTSLRTYAARTAREVPDLQVCCEFLGHVRGGHLADDDETRLLQEALQHSAISRMQRVDEGVARAGRALPGEGSSDPREGVA